MNHIHTIIQNADKTTYNRICFNASAIIIIMGAESIHPQGYGFHFYLNPNAKKGKI
jgi:hypothetical protein